MTNQASAIPPNREVSSAFTVSDQEIMTSARNYFRWQFDLVRPFLGQRIVEIGCGIGNFTDFMKDRGAEILALDIDASCVAAHKQRFSAYSNIQARQLDALGAEADGLHSFRADTVVCLNVLEHIRDDAAAVRMMLKLLQPGGKACLIVPAFEALRGPIDEHLGHYRRYTVPTFRRLAVAAGLEVDTLHYMNFVGFWGWWVNAKVLKRNAQSTSQVKVFDRVIVPIASWAERMVKPPFGQNVFAVVRKAGAD